MGKCEKNVQKHSEKSLRAYYIHSQYMITCEIISPPLFFLGMCLKRRTKLGTWGGEIKSLMHLLLQP